MVEPTAKEAEVLQDAIEGLALAISRSSRLGEQSLKTVSDTKLEKFLYNALAAHGDLGEVTYSWYMAGAKTDVGDDFVGNDQLKTAYQTVTGGPQNTDHFVDSQSKYEPNARVNDYAQFYLDTYDLEEKCFTDGEQFLLDFYERETPSEYHSLYITSQEVRIKLNDLKREIEKLISNRTEDATLAEFGQGAEIRGPNYYDEIAELTSEYHLELISHEELKSVIPQFRKFTDIMEDACLALSNREVERIDASHLGVVKRLANFHYYEAWRLPALVISMNTARGPRSEDLSRRHARELERLNQEYDRKLETLHRKCADAGLIPSEQDYPISDDESIDELISTYLE